MRGSIKFASGLLFLAVWSSVFGGIQAANAGITWSGDVSDPTTQACLYVGFGSPGEMAITEGDMLSNEKSYLGRALLGVGVVTVDGIGSTWTNRLELTVGYWGEGTLHITDGGVVNVMGSTYVAPMSTVDIESTIHFDLGTLNTGSLFATASQLTGTGTINTYGIVRDKDLRFDSSGDLMQSWIYQDSPGQNVTVHLNLNGQGALGAGYADHGSLTIRNGMTVASAGGYLGYKLAAGGLATVEGFRSTWNNSSELMIGVEGNGELQILDGGVVHNQMGIIGQSHYSSGSVLVEGIGSTWTNHADLIIGGYGMGTLDIASGGVVNTLGTTYVASHPNYEEAEGHIHFNLGTLNTKSLLAAASELTGTGTINTHGFVRDAELLFDSVDDLRQSWVLHSGSAQKVTVNLNLDGQGVFGAGYAGNGSLTITNGVVVSATEGYLGFRSGAQGSATITGAGSAWKNQGYFYTGYEGNGVVNVAEGGYVSSNHGHIGYKSGSTGQVTVEGSNSTWEISDGKLYVGYHGSGTLHIADGGKVTSERSSIGFQRGGSNLATVTGQGSNWSSGDMCVGDQGDGTLRISEGGSVLSNNSEIGRWTCTTGVVTVKGNGATWINKKELMIGGLGNAILTISGGGVVNSKTASIANGSSNGAMGLVTVEGPGSIWKNSFDLNVGLDGPGILNITSEGLVSVGGTLTIDKTGDGDSFINMASSGMLALAGNADDSLAEFLDLIEGTNMIRWWNHDLGSWASLTTATRGTHYTLDYLTDGDLAGYTLLTVTTLISVPEPSSIALLVTALVAAAFLFWHKVS